MPASRAVASTPFLAGDYARLATQAPTQHCTREATQQPRNAQRRVPVWQACVWSPQQWGMEGSEARESKYHSSRTKMPRENTVREKGAREPKGPERSGRAKREERGEGGSREREGPKERR